ncbi:MAG: hypothetical protein U1A28_01340 [Patescibacteria group bacterium]|nr:hypothetical protein [Patescibacteria group bacterium]
MGTVPYDPAVSPSAPTQNREFRTEADPVRDKTLSVSAASTTIENGLDIFSANTLIVDDATRLVLAQQRSTFAGSKSMLNLAQDISSRSAI